MAGLLGRLAGDPAVAAFVLEAVRRAGGDRHRAVAWMDLRLKGARPEDAHVRARLDAEVAGLAAVLRERAGEP